MYVYMYVHVCTVHVHVTPLAGSLTQQTTCPLALGSGVSSSAISSFTTLSGEDEGIVIGVGLTMWTSHTTNETNNLLARTVHTQHTHTHTWHIHNTHTHNTHHAHTHHAHTHHTPTPHTQHTHTHTSKSFSHDKVYSATPTQFSCRLNYTCTCTHCANMYCTFVRTCIPYMYNVLSC